ncbi:MAG: ion transporter [Coriobacteriales bacterium]|nr:ion transporter [Coriobacteriales bacterium]
MRDIAKRIVESNVFSFFIIAVIVLNALILGLQTMNLSEGTRRALATCDQICVFIYVVEATLKIFAWRSEYFKDGWNIYDFTITVLSVIPTNIFPVPIEVARILRIFRAFRVFRLISAFKQLRVIVVGIAKSIPGVLWTALLLFVVIYIYAIIGVTLFDELYPERFGDLGSALFSLFEIVTLEGWPDIAYPIIKEMPFSGLYFITFIILSSFILLNVVLGIIVNNIDESRRSFDGLDNDNPSLDDEKEALRRSLEQMEVQIQDLKQVLERTK